MMKNCVCTLEIKLMRKCAQRMYVLNLLRSQGMPIAQLSTVAYSLNIARSLYALPAWGGFITSEHKHRINAFLNALNPMDM